MGWGGLGRVAELVACYVRLFSYSCEEMAARAYDVGVLKLNGVKTNLNFSTSTPPSPQEISHRSRL
jgi:hypothetical protein